MSEMTGGPAGDESGTPGYREREPQTPTDPGVRDTGSIEAVDTEIAAWRSAATSRWAEAVSNKAVEQELRAQLRILETDVQHLTMRLHSAEAEAGELHRQIADLRRSTSWRVTSPIRSASGVIRRARERM